MQMPYLLKLYWFLICETSTARPLLSPANPLLYAAEGLMPDTMRYAYRVICATMVDMKQVVYLIRHGHTSGTEQSLLYGNTELPLTDEGLQEIADFADAGIYPDPDDAEVWTSGMFRTEQTLNQMYGNIEHRIEPLLKEINIGRYEMMSVDEAMADEFGRAWLTGEILEPDFEGGDSHKGFEDRINRGLRNLIDKAAEENTDKIIAVIHGAVITYIMDKAFPGMYENKWVWCPNPGTGYRLVIEDSSAVSWEPVGNIGVNATPVRDL